MNFRRGLRRLFTVLTACYFVVGGGLIFLDWEDSHSTVRGELATCLASVKSYFDINGDPISVPKVPTKESCAKETRQ